MLIAIGFIAAFFFTAVGMLPLLRLLRKKAILDHPNERSSHAVPTPKGAGLLLIPVVSVIWCVLSLVPGGIDFPSDVPEIALLAILLCGFSWIDDIRGLSALLRLVAHAISAGLGLWLLPNDTLVFQGLFPPVLDQVLAVILWVWFINLFNFMDGIDGITGIESLIIGLGVALVGTGAPALLGLVIAAAALGFLKWNWHPAKIFMGDVGSVPIGFLLGWLLLDLAGQGHWAAALILPAYYLLDATVTLVRRGLKGEKVWQAHREHFYQQAVQRGLSHGTVSALVFLLGVMLIAFAYACQRGSPLKILITAFVLSLGFLFFLKGRAKS